MPPAKGPAAVLCCRGNVEQVAAQRPTQILAQANTAVLEMNKNAEHLFLSFSLLLKCPGGVSKKLIENKDEKNR